MSETLSMFTVRPRRAVNVLSGTAELEYATSASMAVDSLEFSKLQLKVLQIFQKWEAHTTKWKAYIKDWSDNDLSSFRVPRRTWYGAKTFDLVDPKKYGTSTRTLVKNAIIRGFYEIPTKARKAGRLPRATSMNDLYRLPMLAGEPFGGIDVGGLGIKHVIDLMVGDMVGIDQLASVLESVEKTEMSTIIFGPMDIERIMALDTIETIADSPDWDRFLQSLFYKVTDGAFDPEDYDSW